MRITIHLIKQELLAHRGLFMAWGGIQSAIALIGITGLAGEFHRAQTSLMTEQIVGLLDVLHGIGIVLLPGAIALANPPADKSAHWRALPVRPGHLLISKLATVLVAVVLPILCAQTLSLIATSAGRWTAHLLLDQLGHLPSWIGVGFCFGAIAGNWKRFATAIATLLVGMMLLMFIVEATTEDTFATGQFQIFLMLLEAGLEDFFINNVLLLGVIAAIGLVYFARVRSAWLYVVFVLGVPATALVAPRLLAGMIPDYRPPSDGGSADIGVSYELPKVIVVVTNRAGVRWQGHVNYSALHFHGVKASQFVLPTRLHTRLWTHNDERTSFTEIGQDWFGFAGSPSLRPWDLPALDLLERHIALSNAVPGMRVINPPFAAGDGFRLFDLEEHMALRNTNLPIRLSTVLNANVGTYEKTGELPLRVGAGLSANGTGIRVAALNYESDDKTQIKLNVRHVRFATEKDDLHARRYLDPRRSPRNLRYILVNEALNEACMPTNREWTERPEPRPLAFQTIVLEFAIADGTEIDRPIDPSWLKGAELHVFRAIVGNGIAISNTVENVNLFNIPRVPVPQHIDYRNR